MHVLEFVGGIILMHVLEFVGNILYIYRYIPKIKKILFKKEIFQYHNFIEEKTIYIIKNIK
jgi:hypothetical protein